jgi:hypothetical protein
VIIPAKAQRAATHGANSRIQRALNMTSMYYIYGDLVPVKTTILLKDEIYEQLVKKYGRRKISKTINEVLTK